MRSRLENKLMCRHNRILQPKRISKDLDLKTAWNWLLLSGEQWFARPRLAFLTDLGKALFTSDSLEIPPEFSQNWIHVPALSMHVPIISYINKRKLVLLGFGVVVIYFKESTMFSSVLFPELECVSDCVVLSSFITAYMN